MDLRGALLGAIEEVLDKMAFMFFDEAAEDTPDPDDYAYITYVGFEGVVTGTLNIHVSQPAGANIARNLIGIRDEDELFEETLQDALREFTNLLMGRTMTLLAPDGPFDMGVPELVQAPEPVNAEHTELAVDGLLDDAPFRLLLRYRETPEAARRPA